MRVLAIALVALVVAGCGGEDDGASTGVETRLEIAVTGGGADERWTLTCGPAGGDHPDPEAACAAIAEHADALDPLAGDVACTQLYGGPQEADVEGTIAGEQYRGSFNRRNGCEIARWEQLQPLLVVRGGA